MHSFPAMLVHIHKTSPTSKLRPRENFKVGNSGGRAPLFDVDPSISRPRTPPAHRVGAADQTHLIETPVISAGGMT